MNCRHKTRQRLALVALAAFIAIAATAQGQEAKLVERVPRVLLVGDSWTGFVWAFRTFRDVFDTTPGLEDYIEVGARTAIMGEEAEAYAEPEKLAILTEELERYPTIDMVHMCLGGNDFISSNPDNYAPEVLPGRIAAIVDYVEIVVDHILAVRPNIRIGFVGYSYGDHPVGDFTPLEMNTGFGLFGEAVRDMCLTKGRVHYVNSFGLMQYYYGIPQADPPVDPAHPALPGPIPKLPALARRRPQLQRPA